MTRTSITISAIIPVYNGRTYLRSAAESVMAQTLLPVELIVVDDGSTDAPFSVLDGLDFPFPLVRVHQENAGQSAARNHGIDLAQGDYIAFLDQDDVWHPQHLEKLSQPFATRDDGRLGWVYSNFTETDEYGLVVHTGFLDNVPAQNPKRDLENILRYGVIIQPGAALFKKAALNDVGGFDVRLSGLEDDDLFLRLFRRGWTNIYLSESLSTWRVHWASSQFSHRSTASRRYYGDKLMAIFPDDPRGLRAYTREYIAPRFFELTLLEYARALAAGEVGACRDLVTDAWKYAARTDYSHISRKQRAKLILMTRPRLYQWLLSFRAWLPYRLRHIAVLLSALLVLALLPFANSERKQGMRPS